MSGKEKRILNYWEFDNEDIFEKNLDRKSKKDQKLRKKREAEKINETKEKLFEQWKITWKKSHRSEDDFPQEDKIFYRMFVDNYNFVKYKEKINREKNFRAKKIYVGVLFLESIIFLAFIVYSVVSVGFPIGNVQVKEIENWIHIIRIVLQNAIVGTGLYTVARIVAKWIGIAKYQETWSRHMRHAYLIEKEMFLYVQKKNPYDTDQRNDIFQDKIMKIWDQNQEKFTDNMEKKEEKLSAKN